MILGGSSAEDAEADCDREMSHSNTCLVSAFVNFFLCLGCPLNRINAASYRSCRHQHAGSCSPVAIAHPRTCIPYRARFTLCAARWPSQVTGLPTVSLPSATPFSVIALYPSSEMNMLPPEIVVLASKSVADFPPVQPCSLSATLKSPCHRQSRIKRRWGQARP